MNLPKRGANNGSEQDGQSTGASMNMVKELQETIQNMFQQQQHIFQQQQQRMFQQQQHMFQQFIRQQLGEFYHKIVNKIQSTSKKTIDGNKTNTNAERELHLKFLEEPNDALTGKEVRGKGGDSLRLGIFDDTEQVIQIDAKVEIFLLKSENDIEENWSSEAFNSRIISGENKKEPHFAKPYHVYLVKGIGVITNAKLANDQSWLKLYRCRLGARVVGRLGGTNIREGWTVPFNVRDSRDGLYKKHYPPLLSDEVWRLENVGKDGARYKRLKKEKISTVEEFLFALSVAENHLREIIEQPDDPKKKKQQFNDADWKATVAHALTCNIDDKRLCVYNDSSKPDMSVVFNIVGRLRGVIYDHYVPIDCISEADEKRRAEELMLSAFENRDSITYYKNEETLVTQFSNKKKRKLEDLVLGNVENLGVTSPPHPVNEPNPDEEQGGRGGGGVGVAIAHGTEGASSSCIKPSGDANNGNAPPDPNINSLEPISSMERSPHRDCNKRDFGVKSIVKHIPVTSPLPPGPTCQPSPLDEPNPLDQEQGGGEGGAPANQHEGEDDLMSVYGDLGNLPPPRPHNGHSSYINVAVDFGGKEVDMEMAELVSQTSPRYPQLEDGTFCNNNILQEDSIGLDNSGAPNASILQQSVLVDAPQPPQPLSAYANDQLLEDTSLTMPPESHDYDHASSNSRLAAGSFAQDLAKDLSDVPQLSPSLNENPFALSVLQDCFLPKLG